MRNFLTFAIALMMTFTLSAQESERKLLSIEDVVLNRELSPKTFPVQWVGQSDSYSTVEGETLVATDARNNKKRTIISLEELNSILSTDFKRFPAYAWEDDNSLIVNAHSQRNIIDLKTRKVSAAYKIPVGANLTRQSGKGGIYAYTKENNLFCFDGEREHQITNFEDKNIVCGQSVSRNEFGISGGIFFSPDGKKIAFYQKDESRVTDFPLLDINTRTGTLRNIKYPMNGMDSEHVSLGVYDIASGKTTYLNVTDFDAERYLTCITWSPDSERIYIQVLDRAQKNIHLNSYNASTGEFLKQILSEHNDRWVEPQYQLVFLKNDPSRFIYSTDNRDGFWNLYICNDEGKVERLTKVNADVKYVAQDDKFVYYTSAEVSPAESHLFKVEIASGKATRLTKEAGWHEPVMSKSGKFYLDTYSSLNVPRVVDLGRTDLKPSRELFRAEDPTVGYNFCNIELGKIKSADGKFDNFYRLIKPLDFDPTKKYPVVMLQYSGPTSQRVLNNWRKRFGYVLADAGYLVVNVDGRGTNARGREWRNATYMQLGVKEAEDQISAAQYLKSLPYVDANRMAICGWSYGGYQTLMCLSKQQEMVWQCGIAIAPVTSWRLYDSAYTERFMRRPQVNDFGYEGTDLMKMAGDLTGELLIVHGLADDNVHAQNTLLYTDALVKAGKQFEMQLYVDDNHSIRKPANSEHLHKRIMLFLQNKL